METPSWRLPHDRPHCSGVPVDRQIRATRRICADRPLHAVCRVARWRVHLRIVTHTWLVMGLVVPVTVAGSSMAPTLDEPQRLLVDRTAFAWREPRRWEDRRLPFAAMRRADLCIKRVVGLPGETVARWPTASC